MITVTRLNGSSFILNALYIESVEAFPDTTITLTNGRKYVVREPVHEVLRKAQAFYQSINLMGKVDPEELGYE